MGRHRMLLAALLVQPDPAKAPLDNVVLDLHGDSRTDARKSVDRQADQRPITQTTLQSKSMRSAPAAASP